jgi:uncharacterized protein with beta-barrel porin domain
LTTAFVRVSSRGFKETGAAAALAGDDAGFDVDINANERLGIGYAGRLSSEAEGHGVKGNFRVRF